MLIKCPECGHQVSDKAPLCPNCGIEIAGKVSTSTDGEAPKTGNGTDNGPTVTVMPMDEEEEVIATPIIETPENGDEGSEDNGGDNGKQGGGHSTLIVSALIAAIICGVGLYFYKDAVDRMNVENKTPQTVAVTDSTETPLETETETEIPAVQDTIHAATAIEEPPVETEADVEEEKPAQKEATDEERAKAAGSVRRFLRAINSHDRDALTTSVASYLTSFNGKSSATKYDVLQYMVDLYQADVKNLNWHIDNIESVEKRENSEGKTEYAVTAKATKETEREGGTSKHKFNIKAVVDSDGKISAANITRVP